VTDDELQLEPVVFSEESARHVTEAYDAWFRAEWASLDATRPLVELMNKRDAKC
jgi:hypothetical protein